MLEGNNRRQAGSGGGGLFFQRGGEVFPLGEEIGAFDAKGVEFSGGALGVFG